MAAGRRTQFTTLRPAVYTVRQRRQRSGTSQFNAADDRHHWHRYAMPPLSCIVVTAKGNVDLHSAKSGHRSSTMRPYHAGDASAALAACPSTSRVQGCMQGTPVAGWSDTRIHSRRHPTRYGQSPSAMLSCHQDMPHTMDAYSATEASVQQAPRVEQFTAAPATRHELCAFQASIENISIWELVNHGTL